MYPTEVTMIRSMGNQTRGAAATDRNATDGSMNTFSSVEARLAGRSAGAGIATCDVAMGASICKIASGCVFLLPDIDPRGGVSTRIQERTLG